MIVSNPTALFREETRVRYGPVPRMLGSVEVGPEQYVLLGDAFLMRTRDGLAFHYRRGEGVTVELSPDADPADEGLYLNGSVYAAAAVINGFYPVHASAIAYKGSVIAFCGPSGAGKSTLIAELGRRGYPMFCDDTLILSLRGKGQVLALPGHKRLKLTPAAVALTETSQQERVARTIDKFYAAPASGTVDEPLPLSCLVRLEFAEQIACETIRGGAAIRVLQEEHYTRDLYLAATRPDSATRFAQLSRIAQSVRIVRFARPCDEATFREGVESLELALDALLERGRENRAAAWEAE